MDRDEARRVFEVGQADIAEADESASPFGEPDAAPAESGFTILLTGVPGSMRAQPEVALERVAGAVGKPGVRLMAQTGDRPPLIVYGAYADADSGRAQGDLRMIRALEVEGRQPFTGAVLIPETDAEPTNARLSRHDLRQAKKLYGEEAVYTLQIGVYTREDNRRPSAADLRSFREAAEDAVERLRREGDEAFFYHGPNGSMVTIGVYNDRDLDTSVAPPLESGRLREARTRHPHNLLNGRGVRETVRTTDGERTPQLQASRLVLIPE